MKLVKDKFLLIGSLVEDAQNNRWIVLEGFTYAPSVAKRDYMFELEAILRTIQFVE